MAHFLDGKRFSEEGDVISAISEYFGSLSQEFFEKGIISLADRWRQVVDNGGEYIN